MPDVYGRAALAAVGMLVAGLTWTALGCDGDDGRQTAIVTRHVDGDTVRVRVLEDGPIPSGEEIPVRLLLVDTPETVHPTVADECYGDAASEMTRRLIPLASTVELESDVELQDRYGRWLAYVWAGDVLVNEMLVAGGYGTVVVYAPNDRYEGRLLAAQEQARGAHRGLWGQCVG
jgi:micrococcal nuclease